MSDQYRLSLSLALSVLKQAGFDERSDQIKMMESVEQSFEKNEIVVIEGGTGVGKTFGYLVPLLLSLHHHKTISKPPPVVI